MALQLKMLIELNVQGDRLYVTDKTGAYNALSNTGGWGAPNPVLAKSALAVLAKRISSAPTQLTFVSNSATHNPLAPDTAETSFELVFSKDGHIQITLFRLRVSNDGIVDLDGDPLAEEDYFFYNGAVNQLTGGIPVEVTDYSVMKDNVTIAQSTCDDLVYPYLKKKAQELRLDYKNKRDCTDDAEEAFAEFRSLYYDLIGTDWDFTAGLVTQAENNIDKLLEQYDLL